MSDPPISQDTPGVGAITTPAPVDDVPMELVKEGYIRVTEIFYNWTPYLDPWQVNAVKALTNPASLTHPDHPLWVKGEEGLKLFNCIKPEGYEMLCFSLRQIEYLQYYIHEMRLADPEWTRYLAKLSSANEADQPKEGEELIPPPYIEEENQWVPMPSAVLRASDFVEVETVHFDETRKIRQFLNAQRKHNQVLDKQLNKMQHMSSEDRARAEAEIDNDTSGPGLRRGPPRRHERKERHEERPAGTGWGGFPLKDPNDTQEITPIAEHEPTEWQEDDTGKADVVPTSGQAVPKRADSEAGLVTGDKDMAPSRKDESPAVRNPEVMSDTVKTPDDDVEDAEIQPDALADQMNKLNALRAKLDAETVPSEVKKQEVDDPMEGYYFDAQQAMLLASAGGLGNALREQEKEAKAEQEEQEGKEDAQIPLEIGRSLFFALRLTTWEEDENVVLEVGWAATWWQERLGSSEQEAKPKIDGEEADNGQYERMTEQGHIIVQDHLLDKRNGKTKPDNRTSYNFGASTPLQASEVNQTIKRKMQDLAKRAGGGPIYLLIHSSDADELEYKKLGWKTSGWEKEIRPNSWEYPSYASAEGVGKVFLIDTARLFGAIENDQSILPALGRTRKSLEEVARIMFGQDEEMAPKACGNAGNDAAYCLQVYLSIVNGMPLEVLRADYRQSLEPITIHSNTETDPGEDNSQSVGQHDKGPDEKPSTSKVEDDFAAAMRRKAESKLDPILPVSLAPVTPPAKEEVFTPQIELKEEEGEDSDHDGGIKGVYWEDKDGKMVELE